MLKTKKTETWEKRVEEASADNNDKFWKLLKAVKRDKEPNATVANVYHYNNQDKADIIAKHLQSQFSNNRPTQSTLEAKAARAQRAILRAQTQPLAINMDGFTNKIKYLKSKKSPGIDNIPPRALKILPPGVLQEILKLFNAIFATGYFTDEWKKAAIITIPKKRKDPCIPVNRRPISLLSVLSKTLERLILNKVNEHIKQHGIIPPTQFGFRENLSATQQAFYLKKLVDAAYSKKRFYTFVALIDVEKAFDQVWKGGLIHKMFTLHFPIQICKLVTTFLLSTNCHALKPFNLLTISQ